MLASCSRRGFQLGRFRFGLRLAGCLLLAQLGPALAVRFPLAIGVTMDGERDVLGMWFQANEGAKFWLSVLTETKNRGVEDVCMVVCDALKGLPEQEPQPPAGIVRIDGDYYYTETRPGQGIASLGVAEDGVAAGADADLIRNQVF